MNSTIPFGERLVYAFLFALFILVIVYCIINIVNFSKISESDEKDQLDISRGYAITLAVFNGIAVLIFGFCIIVILPQIFNIKALPKFKEFSDKIITNFKKFKKFKDKVKIPPVVIPTIPEKPINLLPPISVAPIKLTTKFIKCADAATPALPSNKKSPSYSLADIAPLAKSPPRMAKPVSPISSMIKSLKQHYIEQKLTK